MASRAIFGCLSSFPIPLLLSKVSLSPLRVTQIHFTLSSYERTLRFSTSFSISGLARLGVKPRLCRSFWTAFASTYPLMLPSTSPRKALLAFPPSSLRNQLFFTMKPTLSTPYFRSDPSHSSQDAALAHFDSLPSQNLVLWTDSFITFRFGKDGSGVLANCPLPGSEAILSFSAGPLRSSFSTEACVILQALC